MASGLTWIREAMLAGGLVVLVLISMWVATGSFPPMVVVESNSMQHDENGEVGSIDAGDLVLVMSDERQKIITYAEATEEGSPYEGYESHGMPGDVIIYRKNGGTDTPVIHRALLKVVANDSGGWDAPGTHLRNVETISWTFDIQCPYHGGTYNLTVENWDPVHEGYLSMGDNNKNPRCMFDQSAANGQSEGTGLSDGQGNPVQTTKEEWIVGVAGSEIPWVGAIKLGLSNNSDWVPSSSWTKLVISALILLAIPAIWERVANRTMESAPEIAQAELEEEE